MCNEAARRISLNQIRDDWSEINIPLRFPEGFPNLAAIDSFRITDTTLIIRAARDTVGKAEAVMRRWSWPGPPGKPVYNYRSEGREFGNSETQGRCLIAVDAFYEFTMPAGAPKSKRKDKWAFTKAAEDWFGIAGLWRSHPAVDTGGGQAFTMLTTEPGPDVAPYHSRQIVIVERADWGRWIDGTAPTAEICRPLPTGTLNVAAVRSAAR